MADWLIQHFPEHVHYVEPFFGGGSVLFSKPESLIDGHSEVINDLDGNVVNFFRVLQDEELRGRMLQRLQFMPVSESEFQSALDGLRGPVTLSPELRLRRAIDFFVVNRQSRQGLGKDFNTLSRTRTRRGMNEQASAWLSAINDLEAFAERLKRVVILNQDFRDTIIKNDGPDSLFFLDPPYLPETRVAGEYEHEMTEQDHQEMLDLLSVVEGKFVLCGYESEMYKQWASQHGFKSYSKETTVSSSSAKTKGKRTETIWTNT